jgi:hypothetical protein
MERGEAVMRWAIGVGLVGVAGALAFLVVTRLLGGAGGEVGKAAPPPQQEFMERWQRAMATAEAERQKPPFRGTLNGIRLHQVDDRVEIPWWVDRAACGQVQIVEFEAAKGTPLYFEPTYLPKGAVLSSQMGPGPGTDATVCERSGEVIGAGQHYQLPSGSLDIFRNRAAHEWFINASAERVRAGEVNGRPAVFVLPEVDDPLFAHTMVIVAEPFGITVVIGEGLPFDEVLKVARGVRP